MPSSGFSREGCTSRLGKGIGVRIAEEIFAFGVLVIRHWKRQRAGGGAVAALRQSGRMLASQHLECFCGNPESPIAAEALPSMHSMATSFRPEKPSLFTRFQNPSCSLQLAAPRSPPRHLKEDSFSVCALQFRTGIPSHLAIQVPATEMCASPKNESGGCQKILRLYRVSRA